MKRIISLLLSVAMILSFAVFPASAAGEDVTLKITPNKTEIDTSAGDVEVEYTISVEVRDSSVKIGGMEFGLNPPAGMTLPTKFKDGSNVLISYINKSEWIYDTETETGIFQTFGYTPTTNIFIASGTTEDRNLNENKDLMKIRVTIAKGTTGSLTLTDGFSGKPTVFSKIDGGAVKWSYAVETTPVTILKAPISSVTASVEKPVAGQALDTSVDLGGATAYTGTVKWYVGETEAAEAIAKANTKYTAKITLTASSGENFANSVTIPTGYTKDSSSTSSKLVLTKTFDPTGSLPAATVTAAPTAYTSLEYNGSEQFLLNFVGTAPNGTMHYSLDNATWSTAIPKGKNAGDYTVYYKAVGSSGYSDSAVASISATIGPKDISGVTIDAIARQPYTGSELTPDPEVKDGTTPLVKDTDYIVSYTKNKYVGINTATLTITGKGNYTGTKNANFTITAVDQNPTFTTPVNLARGGAMLDLTTLVSGAKGNMIFTIASGTAANLEMGNTLVSTGITGVVTITVTIKAKDVDGDGNNEYKAYTGTNAITVNVVDKTPDNTTMKVSQGDITYGGSVAPSVTNKPDGTGTVSYTYEGRDGTTYSSSATAPTNVGKYKVKAKCESSTTIYTAEDNFEILAKSISGMTVTLDKTSLEYNGSAQTVNVTGVGTLTATDYTVTSGDSGTDVGSYTVIVTGKGNYKDTAKATWKITPATLTVTPKDNQSKKFKETDPALTYTYSGNAYGQTPAFNGKLDREAGENVGTYAIKLGNLALTNYGAFKASNYTLKLSSTTVNFEIKKADARTLADIKHNLLYTTTSMQVANVGRAGMPEDAGTLAYAKGAAPMLIAGETVQVLDWSVDPVTGTVSYKLTNGSINNRVRFPVVISSTNYEDSTVFVEIKLIDKTDVSGKITFPDGKLVYNGNSQKYEKATISIAASGTAKWTYNYLPITGTTANLNTDNLPLTVGKYTVVATYEDDTQFGTKSATLEITQATPTVTPKFDKITEKDKTLADTHLTIASSSLTGGKIEWVDDLDHALPGNTKVEANKAYKWKYTPAPADAVNYAPVYGTIVVYPVSTGIVIYSPCYTIKASAGANGTISPAGWCSVVENGSQTFTFTPDKGYTVAKVLVDGKSVGAVKSYTFKNVTKDHTIEVIFMKSNGNPATGVFVMP